MGGYQPFAQFIHLQLVLESPSASCRLSSSAHWLMPVAMEVAEVKAHTGPESRGRGHGGSHVRLWCAMVEENASFSNNIFTYSFGISFVCTVYFDHIHSSKMFLEDMNKLTNIFRRKQMRSRVFCLKSCGWLITGLLLEPGL